VHPIGTSTTKNRANIVNGQKLLPVWAKEQEVRQALEPQGVQFAAEIRKAPVPPRTHQGVHHAFELRPL
jgi:hypothetical protein